MVNALLGGQNSQCTSSVLGVGQSKHLTVLVATPHCACLYVPDTDAGTFPSCSNVCLPLSAGNVRAWLGQ